MGQMGQEKFTGEIENTHTISDGNLRGRGTFRDLDLDEILQTVR